MSRRQRTSARLPSNYYGILRCFGASVWGSLIIFEPRRAWSASLGAAQSGVLAELPTTCREMFRKRTRPYSQLSPSTLSAKCYQGFVETKLQIYTLSSLYQFHQHQFLSHIYSRCRPSPVLRSQRCALLPASRPTPLPAMLRLSTT